MVQVYISFVANCSVLGLLLFSEQAEKNIAIKNNKAAIEKKISHTYFLERCITDNAGQVCIKVYCLWD